MSETWDVIVIGAGPAGENAADYAIRGSDRSAAVVESELVGGECSYWACIPSKALLRPLDVVGAAQHLPGVQDPVRVDREALLQRRDTWVSSFDDSGQVGWAQGAGIEVVRGHGRLTGERSVEVVSGDGDVRRLTARHAVVLATGSIATVPAVLRDVAPWTSRDATAVTEVPDRVAVVGGGVVACESARWLAALGSEVTMVVRGPGLLAGAEPFAGDLVQRAFEDPDGRVTVRTGTEVTAARRDTVDVRRPGTLHGGPVSLELSDGSSLDVDEVLVATGRAPAVEDVGLDAVDLEPDDVHGRTHGGRLPDWLFTVGDVNQEAPVTHWGKHQARQVGRVVAARAEGRPDPAAGPAPVPQVVFSEPQVAWVGLTEAAARDAGVDVETRDADYTSAAGAALLRDDATGRARLVVERDTGVLLGATFVGPDVAELLHSASVAVTGGLDLATLRRAVPSFPTASEVWLRLVE